MHEADDFDHAIPPQAVDDEVPGAPYGQFFRDQAVPQTERVNTHTGDG